MIKIYCLRFMIVTSHQSRHVSPAAQTPRLDYIDHATLVATRGSAHSHVYIRLYTHDAWLSRTHTMMYSYFMVSLT